MEPLALIFTRENGSISEVILIDDLRAGRAEFRVIDEDGLVFAPGTAAETLNETFFHELRSVR